MNASTTTATTAVNVKLAVSVFKTTVPTKRNPQSLIIRESKVEYKGAGALQLALNAKREDDSLIAFVDCDAVSNLSRCLLN